MKNKDILIIALLAVIAVSVSTICFAIILDSDILEDNTDDIKEEEIEEIDEKVDELSDEKIDDDDSSPNDDD